MKYKQTNKLNIMRRFISFSLMLAIGTTICCNKKTGNADLNEDAKKDSIQNAKITQDSIDFANSNGKLTAEILWKFGRLGDIHVSPDLSSILFGIKYYNLQTNKGNTNLYTSDIKGGDPIQLTEFKGSEFNSLWRPDGKKIGFLSAESGSVQLWEMNPDGSEMKQLSHIFLLFQLT